LPFAERLKLLASRAFNFHVRAGARRSSSNANNGDRLNKVPTKLINPLSGRCLPSSDSTTTRQQSSYCQRQPKMISPGGMKIELFSPD
jgi:hypothetical protein